MIAIHQLKNQWLFICVFLFTSINSFSQSNLRQPNGGGSYKMLMDIKDEITTAQRARIILRLQTNEVLLRSKGKLQANKNPTATAFEWPVKQALNNNDNGYYGISNYVDENPAYPNQITDYNCGTRSYDVSSGYNHAGTDIFTWPFSWKKMERNAVEVIAAASGTIIDKSDGNFDQNCTFCTSACNWNAVYVMHADGSVAWYGHMKSGSLTNKLVGESVAVGEYLGVLGSSGNSTGPHLHFEVYTNSSYTQLVDPWAGPCNNLNGFTSWWANQQSYYVSTLNKVMTHNAAPATGNCPSGENTNEKINFANGETVYFGSYYRDQLAGQQSIHTIYRPDNTVYSSWTQNFNIFYSASWWYYTAVLPSVAPAGVWRYEILYNGTQRQTAYFSVNNSIVEVCPNSYNVLTSNITGASYQWQVNTGAGFVNISNNTNYAGTSTSKLQLNNVPSSFYGYQYRCFNGTTYSNVLTLKFVSYWLGYDNKAWENPRNWSCGNIPDANTDVIVANNSNTPELSSNVSCRSTNIKTGGNINVKSGYTLTITH
jgi:murein DD-endopeptidase MepM/ murein hydrolase activator NlpD